MNKRVAGPAKCDLELRILNVSPVMHHDVLGRPADPAGAQVPLDYGFPVSAEVPLRVVPGVVVAKAESDLGGRLTAVTVDVREEQRLGGHSNEFSK